ncbi:MAG: sigma-70 family RNA polymerase sigma factor [Bdellovibrionota bacterium]
MAPTFRESQTAGQTAPDQAGAVSATGPGDEASTATPIIKAQLNMRAWVDEHGDYLFRYTLRHFSDQEVAEDLVQETFLAAVKSARSFAGNSTVRTWLTSILRNKIIDRIRQRTREKQVSFDDVGGDDLSKFFDEHEHWHSAAGPREWGLSPEMVFEQRQFGGVLDGCLKKLPEKFKVIFMLRELDGLTRDEISESFQLSSTNVGVILHRARLLLRDCIQKNWLSEGSK